MLNSFFLIPTYFIIEPPADVPINSLTLYAEKYFTVEFSVPKNNLEPCAFIFTDLPLLPPTKLTLVIF
jgi:hypothetical protein